MKRPNMEKPTLETFQEFVLLSIESRIYNMHFIMNLNNEIWKEYVQEKVFGLFGIKQGQ